MGDCTDFLRGKIETALRNCKAYKTKSDLQTTMLMAADLIESLQARLAERDKELKRLQKEVASLAIESIEREKTLAKLEAEVMAAIDAAPVVRCGDCKYGTWLESCQRRRCDYWTCFRNGMVYGRANTVNENDYCSHGEQMESEGE